MRGCWEKQSAFSGQLNIKYGGGLREIKNDIGPECTYDNYCMHGNREEHGFSIQVQLQSNTSFDPILLRII